MAVGRLDRTSIAPESAGDAPPSTSRASVASSSAVEGRTQVGLPVRCGAALAASPHWSASRPNGQDLP